MSDAQALEVGGVYRDPGDGTVAPVDFIVGRIEDEPTTEGEPVMWIAHVQIGPADRGDGIIMGHAPLTLAVATAAASEKLGQSDVTEPFREGYDAWRAAFDIGEAGVFTVGPAAIYAMVGDMLASRLSGA